MKNNSFSKLIRISLALLLLIAVVSLTTSCNTSRSKEEILDNISSAQEKNFNYVIDYLIYFGVPKFDTTKFIWAEKVFQTNFNLEGGLPSVYSHAKMTASSFMEKYYDTIDKDDKGAVTDALITCYVEAVGDPYSIYRTPVEQDDYSEDMSGKFGGIGVVIEYDHTAETLMITSVYIDSPAEAAGVKVGDYIAAVEGKTVEEIGYLDVVNLVRGEIGTDVRLTLLRGDTLVDVVAVRDEVEEKTVAYEILEDNIGYVQIAGFKANTAEQFIKAIDALEAASVSAFIFDLRNNLGGYVSAVIDCVSYLIPKGYPIISYQYKGSPLEVINSTDDIHPTKKDPLSPSEPLKEDHAVSVPIVVLCNEYTASAGELFTAAMRDYNKDGIVKATTVGKKTFGKGIMQSQGSYYDGSTITLTVAYYNPPSGKNYHIDGIVPDTTAENIIDESNTVIDVQLSEGIKQLKSLINDN